MKRFFLATFAVGIMAMFAFGNLASARNNVGVIGGATFNTSKLTEVQGSTLTQWHAGLAFKFRLPLGFAIQPSILYQVKGTKLQDARNLNIGYLEVPVSVQWGPDLIICRPFAELTPFVGYGLNNSIKDWRNLNRWEYGVGLGAGIDIWRFQINARYNWNLGKLSNANISSDAQSMLGQEFRHNHFGGVTLSLAYFF